MNNIKSFEQFNESILNMYGTNDTFLGNNPLEIVKNILLLPIALLSLGITNLINPRIVDFAIAQKHLNIYNSLDTIKKAIEEMLESGNLIGREEKKAIKAIKEINKVKSKYPTLKDYKEVVKKNVVILNIRNKKFLETQIDKFEPRTLDLDEWRNTLQKISKVEGGEKGSEIYWDDQRPINLSYWDDQES